MNGIEYMTRDQSNDFAKLYTSYAPMVLRRCQRLLHDDEQAADAMQDVFVRLLKRYDPTVVQYPSSLLYRIATNVCLNLIRSSRACVSMENEAVLKKISFCDDVERQTFISRMLDRIFCDESLSTRTMAVLHFVDGLTLEETAREFNMSTAGVKKRLRQFRRRQLKNKEG
jgi:RNA polymerase sigma-70 factor (ECF subfamily)